MTTRFVKYPENHKKIWLSKTKSNSASSRVRDVRWGDYLNVSEETEDGWSKIKWGKQTLFIETENTNNSRPDEVIFVDVGQGDGCIFVSSETGDEEKVMIIDAGESDNMYKFLKWRFGKFKRQFQFHAAIITHPDSDHYYGFRKLFKTPNIGFDKIYHNGLMERTGSQLLGPSDASGKYLTDIIETHEQASTLYSDPVVRGGKWFPSVIFNALSNNDIGPVEMLSAQHGTKENEHTYLPDYAPSDNRSGNIEVLGPVPDSDATGNTVLRWFGGDIGSTSQDKGKTKNGHSVILKLNVGNFNLIFGGDLNRPAEDYLLRHYSGIADDKNLSEAVNAAHEVFGADVMKCCHHGAADVTNEFIRAVDAFGYVVSSGDAESHAHPRPDLLGRLGKLGRSDAPMIFCTEILRSTREKGKAEDFKKLRKLDEGIEELTKKVATLEAVVDPTLVQIDDLRLSKAESKKLRKDRTSLQKHIEKRNVGVYGAITMRTDGNHLKISFRLESPRKQQLWQSYLLEHDAEDGWQVVSGGH